MSRPGARLARLVLGCVAAGPICSLALAGPLASLALGAAGRQPAVHPQAHVELGGVFTLDGGLATIPGRPIYVSGTVRPYVRGQIVRVWLAQNGKILKNRPVSIRVGPRGDVGHFRVRVASPVTGAIRIDVVHRSTRRMSRLYAPRRLEVLTPQASFGSTGPFVRLIQQRLSVLHFYIPLTGVYDSGTGLALDAYHRLLGWGVYQTLDTRTVNALLNGQGVFHVRFPGHGRHAEADLTNQLLALIDGNTVVWIFPISSGKPSTPTILGDYQIYYREPGYNSEGMYYSDFFIRGYAIHGYNPAPDYPASHGCLRLPIADAIPAYNWLALNDWVDVYN
jgi:hypothetical protein